MFAVVSEILLYLNVIFVNANAFYILKQFFHVYTSRFIIPSMLDEESYIHTH